MKISFRINKNINFVFEYLTDMQKFVSVHPVIFQIDNQSNNKYLAHEKLKLGFIPFSFTYPFTIEKFELENKVTLIAIVFKITKIEIKFNLKADNNFTIIDEEINVESLLPIKFVMESIFKTQHNQLFKNIENK